MNEENWKDTRMIEEVESSTQWKPKLALLH